MVWMHYLGGSRHVSLPLVGSAQNAVNHLDVELDSVLLAGKTVTLVVEVRTLNAGTSITPKLRNVTDANDTAVGSASTGTETDYSGTNQQQEIPVTLVAGVKRYRLQGVPNNADFDTFCIGYLRIED